MLNKKILLVLSMTSFLLLNIHSLVYSQNLPTPLGSTKVGQALKRDLNASGEWNQITFADGSGPQTTAATGTGDVVGPGSSTDNATVRWDSTGGISVQDSGILIDDSDNISGVLSIDITGMSAPAHTPGLLFYDTDDDELSFYNSESDVKLNVGSEMWVKVRNNSGATIDDFTPVYQTGAVGNRATIAKAKADAESTSMVLGITTHQIENNSNGFITPLGTINGVDTDGSPYAESWNDGEEIFLSAVTAGDLTNIAPTGNNIVVILGNVLTATNSGSFHTKINGADVRGFTSSTDNTIVRVDGTSGKRIQGSGIVVDDSNNVSGIPSLTYAGAFTLTATDSAINIVVGTGVGDDFIINTSAFVVEGDTGNVGIGTATATEILTIKPGENILQTPANPVLTGSLVVGSSPSSVYVSGRYVYVVDLDSNDLKIIDVSDPTTPSLIGSLVVGNDPEVVRVSGRYAYVVDIGASNDLRIIDVSDPTTPVLVGSVAIVGREFHVSGRYAYVVGVGLSVIDVSDPTTPFIAGTLATGAAPRASNIFGGYVYVVDSASKDLKVIDVSDPTTPVLAGSLTIGTDPTSVYVSGRYAYVVDSTSNDLKIIDVSGIEITSAMIHSLEAGNLQVRNDIIAQGQLQVTGGIGIGTGGLFSAGSIASQKGAYFGENVGVGTTVFGTSAATVLGLANGTAPSTAPGNMIQMWANDFAAGDSRLYLMSEAQTNTLALGGVGLEFSGAGTINTASADLILQTTTSGDILLNPAGTGVRIGSGSPSSILDVGGDIEIGSADAFFYGDPTTDTTWKTVRSGTKLSFQRRVTGAYVEKGFFDTSFHTDIIGELIVGAGVTVDGVLLKDGTVSGTTGSFNSNATDTTAIMTIENTGGNFQIFRDDVSPESVITGSIGDLAIDTTGGEIYIKKSGSATNTGWQSIGGGVSSFTSMWYHGAELTTSIGTSATFVQITDFENVGPEDAGGNAVGDATTDDDITINLAGTYEIGLGASFKNASGSNKDMMIAPGIILASAKTITGATNATPIVMTVTAHGLLNGDMITQSGVGGNTAANGDFLVTNKGDNTYELETLVHVDVAGNGAYTSGGTVDIVFFGETVLERSVSGTALGRGMSHGRAILAVGDIIELYVANNSDSNNFVQSQISLCVRRLE